MKKIAAGILSVMLAGMCMTGFCAPKYNIEQTYRILSITAEEMVNELKSSGVSDEMIHSFLTDLSRGIAEKEELSEENFNSTLFTVMSGLLQSGSYNNLYIALASRYTSDISSLLATHEVPERLKPLYDTVRTCLLGTGELELFVDIPSDHWAKSAIEALAADGIVNGMGQRRFEPDTEVKREEFVKMAVDCLGLQAQGTAPFADVAQGEWYAPFVAAAYENNIVSGVSETEFGVGQPMLRQDMAVIIDRILTVRGVKLAQTNDRYGKFGDTDEISDYARDAVKRLCGAGLISGVEEDRFAGNELVTRAQAARMIDQMRLELQK